jgi:hypothetical protein
MTTVREIDRLVLTDDVTAARLWPRLGPKVRDAYLRDRDAWVVLRREVASGTRLPAATLVAQQKKFSGWARAFRAAAAGKTKRSQPASVAQRPAAGPASAALAVAPLPAPAAAALTKGAGGAGTAVAGGLVLAGLIAVAARRKRA